MGTGVTGALKEAGGKDLYMEALETGPINLGEAALTNAYELDADYVVHAASMPHYGTGRSTLESIKNAMKSALELAEENNATTIALPAIGCGLGGVSLTTGATQILQVLLNYEPTTIEKVNFVLYTQQEYETVQNLIQN